MSTRGKKQDIPRHEEAGKIIASRLREARRIQGMVVCPVCHITFDATSVLKCPQCRAFIEKTFRHVHVQKSRTKSRRRKTSQAAAKKMELDFFAEEYFDRSIH